MPKAKRKVCLQDPQQDRILVGRAAASQRAPRTVGGDPCPAVIPGVRDNDIRVAAGTVALVPAVDAAGIATPRPALDVRRARVRRPRGAVAHAGLRLR